MAYTPTDPNTQHLLVEPYCILCRDTIPSSKHFVQPTLLSLKHRLPPRKAPEPWKLNVFCFFELPSSSPKHDPTQPRTHIFRANLGDDEWLKGPSDTEKVLKEANLSFCPSSCDQCDPDLAANLVHSTCLLLLKSRAQDIEIKASLLCKIASRLRPLIGWQHGLTMGLGLEPSPSLALSNFGSSSSDALLCAIHQKLPWELQGMIVQRLPGTLASSLSNCLATLEAIEWPRVTEEAIHRSKYQHSYPFSDLPSSPARLSASTVDVLGEVCLASIGSESGLDLEISVTESPILGVEFAYGMHGIVSFRLLYVDGSASSWLGNGRRKWTTRLRCQGLEKLRVVTDGSKMVSIRLGEHSPAQSHCHMAWGQRMPSFSPVKKRYSIIDSGEKALTLRGNHRARFGTFLPIQLNQDQNNRLTIFSDSGGICAIQLNDQPRLGVTNHRCCAVTHYLQPGETLESLHVVTQGDRYPFLLQGPFLFAITSKKRSLSYAPHCLFYQRRFHFSSFDDTGSSFVTGMLLDPSTSNTRRRAAIGVELTPRNTSGEQPSQEVATYPFVERFERSSFPAVHARVVYLSKANLRDTRMLRLQRISLRCYGLEITRTDGTIDILGQWNPSLPDCITVLHEESTKSVLETIGFVCSDDPDIRRNFCKDILVNPTKTSRQLYKVQNLSETIAWWYTYQYDCVEPWTGNDIEVNIGERNITPVFSE